MFRRRDVPFRLAELDSGTAQGRRALGSLGRRTLTLGACVITLACARAPQPLAPAYTPQLRQVTITTVPLLVKEDQRTYPFLAKDFAPGGVLEGKEVYAFSPSSVTVVAGDTVQFTFINPEDDVHSFVMGNFAVALPAQRTVTAMWVASRAGIYPFRCDIPAHLPMMSGEMIVLAPGAVSGR